MHAHEAATPGTVIRKATAGDLAAVVRIWHTGWVDGHAGHVPPELVAYRKEEQFEPRARERLACMWVADSNAEVLGFMVVKGDELEQLYVDRAARGTGVALSLIQQAEVEIRSAGHARAWLAVVAGNQRARAFYARRGWRDAGAMSYQAETDIGPFPVPVRRYELDFSDRSS